MELDELDDNGVALWYGDKSDTDDDLNFSGTMMGLKKLLSSNSGWAVSNALGNNSPNL
jgi:hypothetical protein